MAQSPINFNGTVTVTNNVTLTIDPGVTVNMGYYGFDIYGTLIAQGTPGNQIVFTSIGNQTSQSGSSHPDLPWTIQLWRQQFEWSSLNYSKRQF